MTELEQKIKHYADEYYKGNELISDKEYDLLLVDLKKENPNSPLLNNVVGDDFVQGFKTVNHIMTTGTYSKCATVDEFKVWFNSHKGKYHVSLKIDGASDELIYRNGKLVQAITRGDGFKGLDVTENIKKISDIPQTVDEKFSGSIRGEYYMKKSVFKKYFADVMKNPRNATAGIMKRLDGKDCEKLNFFAYDILSEDNVFESEYLVSQKYNLLSEGFGFKTPNYIVTDKLEDILKFREEMQKNRDTLDFDIDGLVVKNEIIEIDDMQRKTPLRDIAIKFDLMQADSIARKVDWQLQGSIFAPVVYFDEIELDGTSNIKASLHNVAWMKEMGFHDGCKVRVSKHGQIINQVDEVLDPIFDGDIHFNYPKKCHICGADTVVTESGILRCPNEECSQKLNHWFDRFFTVLDVKGVGEAMIKDLVKRYKTPIHMLAEMTKDELSSIFGLNGEKLYDNIRITQKKPITLGKLLALMDFEGYSLKSLEKLPYSSLDELRKITAKDIIQIEGFSDITANELYKYISNRWIDIKDMANEFVLKEKKNSSDGKFNGTSFCFHGTLSHKRKELEEMVIANGGKIGGVTKSLNYLVCNLQNDGSSKTNKAIQLGVKMITEDEFLMMVG